MSFFRKARDDVGERLDLDLHPSSAGMDEVPAVGHDPDMAGKEDEIAAREIGLVDILVDAERGKLQIAVALT